MFGSIKRVDKAILPLYSNADALSVSPSSERIYTS